MLPFLWPRGLNPSALRLELDGDGGRALCSHFGPVELAGAEAEPLSVPCHQVQPGAATSSLVPGLRRNTREPPPIKFRALRGKAVYAEALLECNAGCAGGDALELRDNHGTLGGLVQGMHRWGGTPGRQH